MIGNKLRARTGVAVGFLILIPLMITLGCKTEEVPGKWTSREITIDGKMNEWDSMPGLYFEDSRTLIEFCNDSDNLYVMLRFSSPLWLLAIRMNGLTLWLDAWGKKDKTVGIRYNGAPDPEEIKEMDFRAGIPDPMGLEMPELPEDFTPQEQFLFFDKNHPEGIPIPKDGSKGPEVAYKVFNGYCIYELRIPVSSLRPEILGLQLAPDQRYMLGAEWGDISALIEDMRGSRGPSRGDGPPVGSGMSGGRTGSTGMGSPGPMLPQKQEIWINTNFATPEINFVPENEVL